jgi:hypothetical protein
MKFIMLSPLPRVSLSLRRLSPQAMKRRRRRKRKKKRKKGSLLHPLLLKSRELRPQLLAIPHPILERREVVVNDF